MAEIQYVIFALGNHKYCMRLSKINGIEQSYVVVPIPAGASFMKGIIHLRGEIVPVYSLRDKLGVWEASQSDETQLLLAETHNMVIAFEVDTVLGIETIQEEDVKHVPTVVRSDETDYLESIVHVSNTERGHADIILCISVDHIMSDMEFENVRQAMENSAGFDDAEESFEEEPEDEDESAGAEEPGDEEAAETADEAEADEMEESVGEDDTEESDGEADTEESDDEADTEESVDEDDIESEDETETNETEFGAEEIDETEDEAEEFADEADTEAEDETEADAEEFFENEAEFEDEAEFDADEPDETEEEINS